MQRRRSSLRCGVAFLPPGGDGLDHDSIARGAIQQTLQQRIVLVASGSSAISPIAAKKLPHGLPDLLVHNRLVLAPRIEPDSIEVKLVSGGDPREPAFSVSFTPLGEDWTSKMNLVWGLREGGIQS